MTAAAGAIEIGELRVRRGGNVVLDGLSLDVRAGSVTGLLGPSGSGKSTLIRSIVGVQIVESGHVRVLGQAAGSPSLRSRVGYVTQAPSVYGDLTMRENLRLTSRGYWACRGRASRRPSTRSICGRRPSGSSTGCREGSARVSLATALLNRPELLLLDEPTVGLDRPQLFSNALPPTVACSAREAVRLLRREPELVAKLRDSTRTFRQRLRALGFNPLEGEAAIVPIILGETAFAIRFSERLLEEGVFVTGFGYPVVPEGTARIRVQMSAAIEEEHVERALAAFEQVGRADLSPAGLAAPTIRWPMHADASSRASCVRSGSTSRRAAS